jgi:uncharacterized membrane protein YkoI
MNMRKALFAIAATVAAASGVYAEKVKLEQTPPAVQQAIRSKAGGAEIEDIDRELRNGQVVYEASFKVGGSQQELQVSEAGTILRDVVGASTGLANSNITLVNKSGTSLNEAPLSVQNALRRRFPGGTGIESIQKGIWNGQTVYEASYFQNGQRMTYQVNEAGHPIVSPTPAIGFQPKYAGLSQSNVPLSAGAKMPLASAPKAVQKTVQKVSNGARVEDFERGQWNGRTVYQAAFKKNGQHTELQVLDDGTILTQAPVGGAASSAQASAATGTTGFQPRYAGLADVNVPLSGGSKLSFQSAPQSVKDTVNHFAAGARVEDMESGTWNGRTVYEAAFKKNGQNIELQVLEDGSLLTHAPAGAAVGAPASGTINTGQQP